MEPVLRLRDNPILIAQGRRRLRRRHVVPALLITSLLCVCAVLFAGAAEDKGQSPGRWEYLIMSLLTLVGYLLFSRGTLNIAGQVREERGSGILDFHRATPTTPWTDTAGYLFGCPVREYLLCAAVLPFLLLAGVLSSVPMGNVLLTVPVLVLSGWLYHAAAMSIGLTIDSKRGTAGTALLLVGALLVLGPWLGAGDLLIVAYLTPFPALVRLLDPETTAHIGASLRFYGLLLHPAAVTALVQGSLLCFLVVAAARKVHREGAAAFSRTGALAFFALLVFLLLGIGWGQIRPPDTDGAHGPGPVWVIAAYLIVAPVLAGGLLLSVVPSYLEFVRALRRARRRGLAQAPWQEDGAASWPLVPAFAGLMAIGLLVLLVALWPRLDAGLRRPEGLLCLACALAIMAMAAGAIEYTRLCRRRAPGSTGVLLFFLIMVLPLLLAAIAEAATHGKLVPRLLYALSPGFALVSSAMVMVDAWIKPPADTAQVMTVGLSLCVTAALAASFFRGTHVLRRALSEKIPLGGGPR